MKLRAVLLIAALAACGKSKSSSHADDQPPPDPKGSAAATKTEPPKPVEVAPAIAAPKGMFDCHAKDPAATNTARKPASPWQLPFAWGGCPMVPSQVFGGADFGMDGDAAAKAAKARLEDESAYIYLGKSPFRYQFTFRLAETTKKVEKFTFKVDQDGLDEMKAAWGEPVTYEHIGDKYFTWFNPAKHVKVTAHSDTWNRADPKTKEDVDVPGFWVYFQQYMPLAEVANKDGFLKSKVIGLSAAELQAAFPDWVESKSKEQKKADMDSAGLDKETQAKVTAIGAADASVDLKLPETETNSYSTLVQFDWKDGKIESWSALFPFGKDQALKAEILAVVVAQLGKPVSAKKDDDNWTYTFDGPNNTVIEMGMSILAEDWSFQVHAKK